MLQLVSLFLTTLSPAAQAQVEVNITADNAYAFGWGSGTATNNWNPGVENFLAGDIFSCATGPETYLLPPGVVASGDYLYIAAWHDRGVWQGLLADVTAVGFPPVLSGVGPWEVCPSGQYYGVGSGGPPQAVVDSVIQRCNTGTDLGVTSGPRWLDSVGDANGKLALGEDNQGNPSVEYGTNQYGAVCDIDPGAVWMWMDWAPWHFGPGVSPFIWNQSPAGVDEPSFYLFRLPVDEIPGAVDGCAEIERIEADCVAEGLYDVSFVLTNLSGEDVEGLHIPHAQVAPNVIDLVLPDQTSTIVDVSVTGLPGEEVCFEVILDGAEEGEDGSQPCCVEVVCVTLPDCDCFEVDLRAECIPGRPVGTFQITGTLANTSGTTLEDLFFTAITSPGTLLPGWIDLPSLLDGTATFFGPLTVSGADFDQPYCFEIAAHDETRETCCEREFCVDVPPPCEPGAPVPISACDQTGGAGVLGGMGLLAFALRRRRRA